MSHGKGEESGKRKMEGRENPFLSKERIKNWVTVVLPFLNRKIVG